jgi:parvulin-like peptidyl-prolyl isomerase
MRIKIAFLLPLFVSVRVGAQLAPMPAHEPRRSPPAEATVVARVNGVPIAAGDLDAALNTMVPLNSYHDSVKPAKVEELRKRALDALIDEELSYQQAVRLKIQVPPEAMAQALARARKAYGNREAFERARRTSGATLPQLRASIRRALMIRKAYERVVASRCRVNEAGAAAYYRENSGRFLMPEQLRTSLITISVEPSAPQQEWKRARQKADDLATQITAGASFEALAREHSGDASKLKGGDLGFVHRGQLVEEFERALSGIRPGQVTPVIQTIYGFHLLRLVDVRPAAQKTFADVKATLVRDLTDTRCTQAGAERSKRLRATARIEIVERSAAAGRPAGSPE